MFLTATGVATVCNLKHTNRRSCLVKALRASPIVDIALGVIMIVLGALGAAGILPLPQGIFLGLGITNFLSGGGALTMSILSKMGKLDGVKEKFSGCMPNFSDALSA